MPHLNTEVGRMLIFVEQRLQTVKDRVIAAYAAGATYQQLRRDMAELNKLKDMVPVLESALAN